MDINLEIIIWFTNQIFCYKTTLLKGWFHNYKDKKINIREITDKFSMVYASLLSIF